MGRENIDDAAALTERARGFHQRLMPVAQVNPGGQQFLDAGNALPYPQAGIGIRPGIGAGPGQDRGRQGIAQGGGGGGHDQRRRPVRIRIRMDGGDGQGGQSGQTLVDGAGIHRQPLEGQHFRLRQQIDRGILAQVGQQLVVELPGVLRARGQYQHRPAAFPPQGRQIDRPRPPPGGDAARFGIAWLKGPGDGIGKSGKDTGQRHRRARSNFS